MDRRGHDFWHWLSEQLQRFLQICNVQLWHVFLLKFSFLRCLHRCRGSLQALAESEISSRSGLCSSPCRQIESSASELTISHSKLSDDSARIFSRMANPLF